MLEKFLNIFRIPDLRKRVLFTLGILAVYRLGAWIPTPGVNFRQLELLFNQQGGSALGLMDLFRRERVVFVIPNPGLYCGSQTLLLELIDQALNSAVLFQ